MSVDVERTNELIRLFGEHQYADMRVERRESMRSVLFDLPRRSPLGWQCLYEHAPAFLREVGERATPEEIGAGMRKVGSRPYALQPFIFVCSYLGARQMRMLELGLSQGDPFPEETGGPSLHHGFLGAPDERLPLGRRAAPRQAGGSLPILDEDAVAELSERAPASEDDRTAIRRMAATLELFNFIQHGEQRDGIFGHRPYDLGGGSVLLGKEFNDLRNDYMPWAKTDTRVPVANVAVIQVAHDVEVSCDMFGSMTIHPHEIDDRLERVVVLTDEGGTLRELDMDEVVAIQEAAADAQEELPEGGRVGRALQDRVRRADVRESPQAVPRRRRPRRRCVATADEGLSGDRRPHGRRDARGRASADLGAHGGQGRLLPGRCRPGRSCASTAAPAPRGCTSSGLTSTASRRSPAASATAASPSIAATAASKSASGAPR